ncbi:MAG: aldo/keto reductase [Myxococcales bacterium]|nr:aldo/keto reductase [Myxococcales bacterium]
MRTYSFDNGDTLPAIGLGTWLSAPGEVGAAVKEAIRVGYRHIDCAAIYGNEAEVGAALRECFAAGVVKREELWITSKLWNTAHAEDAVLPALKKTLADLGLDYLDLYLIHWPVALRPGVHMPRSGADMISLEELPLGATWRGMEAAADAGLARHIGVSNHSVKKLRGLLDGARRRPEVNQIELHPYLQQPAMLEFCAAENVHLTAYSPLGAGGRPDFFRGDEAEPVLLEETTLAAIAARHGATPAQVLIAWGVQRGTSVIPKSVKPRRIAENLAAGELTLSDADMAAIRELDRHRRYLQGNPWVIDGGPFTMETLWDEAPEALEAAR